MTEEKITIDPLDLRARPRPVTRLNRKVLIGLAGAGLVLIFATVFFALQPPSQKGVEHQELYNVKNKETPETLNDLPENYQDYKPPLLGAPLPGEIGRAVLNAEKRAGIKPETSTILPFQSNPMSDIERAERIRLAQRMQQGRESTVFFQISQKSKTSSSPEGTSTGMNGTGSPQGGVSERASLAGEGQNGQRGKNDFLSKGPDTSIYNPYQLQTPLSPYQVMAGTVISASLITGLNSDLPGQVIAQVTHPIYDTVTGRHMLIPQGSRLMGKYDSVVAFGQSRALVVWQRLILPDGSSIIIDNLPATDRAGYAGLEDQVDFHTWGVIKGIALSTLFSIGTELAFNDDSDLVRAIQSGSQNSINRTGQKLVERQINVQPTIKIRPGFPLRIIVHKDIILKPFTNERGIHHVY